MQHTQLINTMQQKAFFIAEIGVNHEGSQERAVKMVESAAVNGADAVKFQVYDKFIGGSRLPAYWDLNEEPTSTQYELFKKHGIADLKFYERIIKCCEHKKTEFMITPFSEAIAYEFNPFVKRHKISSSDITNKKLRIYCKLRQKSYIIYRSSSDDEIRSAEELIYSNEQKICHYYIVRHPCLASKANLSKIISIRDKCIDNPRRIFMPCCW